MECSTRFHFRRIRSAVALLPLAIGCSASDEISPTRVANVDSGRVAFAVSCAGCHTTRDAFDIAYFGFASSDIVRRAVVHVSRATAEDIAAYVKSLGIAAVGRDARPFQPGTRVLTSDEDFWRTTFGTSGWPTTLTPQTIRSLDPRTLNVPIALPRWSSEVDDSDWLSELPLSASLLGAANGALRAALDAYYATPTTANLTVAIAKFADASNAGAAALCYGEAGTHARPRECFEARRWMSSLAAQHFLRPGAGAIPIEVADLFWGTGQAAVTVFQREHTHPRSMVWGWLYLGYSFAPTRFNEDNGYLGQFLQSDGLPWLATFTALRRLVAEDEVHNALPGQRFWDAALAVGRAPAGQSANVAEFSYRFLVDWLSAREPLVGEARDQAAEFLDFAHQIALREAPEPAQLSRITALRDQLLARLR